MGAKILEHESVRAFTDGRARRRRESKQGASTTDRHNEWKWTPISSTAPLASLIGYDGNLHADAHDIDDIIHNRLVALLNDDVGVAHWTDALACVNRAIPQDPLGSFERHRLAVHTATN